MNQITITDYSEDGTNWTMQFNELDFYEKFSSFLTKKFPLEGDVGTFAFILNNNSNNYFAEVLSSNSFPDRLNEIINNKITVLWCEPDIDEVTDERRNYEYFAKVKGANPLRIWTAISETLDLGDMQNKNDAFPAMAIIKVVKSALGSGANYEIKDGWIHPLKKYEQFNNVIEFEKHILDLFKFMISTLDFSNKEYLIHEEKKESYFKELAKKGLILELFKVSIKRVYRYLKDFLADIIKDPPDFF